MSVAFDKLTRDEIKLDDRCSRFILGPLKKGLGDVIGTAMRRVLLSSMSGSAVVAARIDGVLHEFSTIPHVIEDVTDIVLNLKGIDLWIHGDLDENAFKTLILEASGVGEVKALDIAEDPDVTILNPDHHVATLSEQGYVRMELFVKKGRRYMNWSDAPYDEQVERAFGLGVIRIDGDFNPITRVLCGVSALSDRHENLELTVCTNGGLSPEQAVSNAAAMLDAHLRIFGQAASGRPASANNDDPPMEMEASARPDLSLDDLDMSFRTRHALASQNIHTLADLVRHPEDELAIIRNLGKKSLAEIKGIVASFDLKLGVPIDK